MSCVTVYWQLLLILSRVKNMKIEPITQVCCYGNWPVNIPCCFLGMYRNFVTNSYGESWDSSCEKSWISVLNQWVPVKNKTSLKWKMLGHLCKIVNLKTDSKIPYYTILKLKYSPSILKHNKGEKKYPWLNNSHNNFHRNYTNGPDISTNTHVQIDRMNYFASLGIFMRQGRRTQKYPKITVM